MGIQPTLTSLSEMILTLQNLVKSYAITTKSFFVALMPTTPVTINVSCQEMTGLLPGLLLCKSDLECLTLRGSVT